MGDVVSTENEESEINPENGYEKELLERTKRWVDERSLSLADKLKHPKLAAKLYWEKNARKIIYAEMSRDIQTSGMQNPLTPEIVAKMASTIPENPKILELRDTLTGEAFVQILRKDGQSLIAEERHTSDLSSDGNLISQAKLNFDGQTELTLQSELTLQFTGERFKRINANPAILHSKNKFPNTAIKVFDTLSKSIS